MWSNFRGLSSSLLHCSKCFTQAERGTHILKRKHTPRLSRLGEDMKKLRRKEYYYEVVTDTDYVKKTPLEIVLCQDVPGLGMKGEVIESNIYSAYRDLLLPRLGLYADSPEAKSIIGIREEQEYSSVHVKAVEKHLAVQALSIILSAETKWKLEPWHVKLALRKVGVLTKDECITIPKEITGPDPEIENKDFLIQLTMNKKEKFYMRCRIYHWSSSNPMLNKKEMDVRSPSEPLFPDEKEKIDEIIKFDLDLRRKKMMSGR